jgi:hypothetical protein
MGVKIPPRRNQRLPFAEVREIYTPGIYPCVQFQYPYDEQQTEASDLCLHCGFTLEEHRRQARNR